MSWRQTLVRLLPIVLFTMGCIWVLLFPAMNVTSGELKSRGLYVDEHALLVQSPMFRNPQVVSAPANLTQSIGSLNCSERVGQDALCTTFRQPGAGNQSLLQIEIVPTTSKIVHESTVLVVRYTPNDLCIKSVVAQLVSSIVMNLRGVSWVARKVIILLVPDTDDRALSDWLAYHHQPSKEMIDKHIQSMLKKTSQGTDAVHVGIIREAYVLDLTQQSTPSTGTSCSSDGLAFSSMTLHHTGRNGLLPNMDMVAYPLAMHAGLLDTESAVCAAQLTSQVTAFLQRLRREYSVDSIIEWAADFLTHAWKEVDTVPVVQQYRDRLLGLGCSMFAHVVPSATSSLHSQFLPYNIDAITVSVSPASATEASRSTGMTPSKKQPQQQSSRQESYGVQKLTEVALSFLYISNNLHEELHHSHFFYLLMGNGYFVGISEYGFTAALFLLSVLALFQQMCAHVTYIRIPYAIVAVALELLGVVLCVCVDLPTVFATPGANCTSDGVSLECALVWCGSATACVTVTYLIGVGCVLLSHLILTFRLSPKDFASSAASTVTKIEQPAADTSGSITLGSDAAAPVTELQPSAIIKESSVGAAVDRLAVYLLGLLAALAYVFIQNFSLGVLLAVAVVPTLLTASWAVLYSGDSPRWVRRLRSAVLAALVLLHSPLGMFLAAHLVGAWRCVSSEVCGAGAGAADAVAVLHELVGRDTFAALLLLNTAASFVAVTALLALLYMH